MKTREDKRMFQLDISFLKQSFLDKALASSVNFGEKSAQSFFGCMIIPLGPHSDST
jgi:hypothetical protein